MLLNYELRFKQIAINGMGWLIEFWLRVYYICKQMECNILIYDKMLCEIKLCLTFVTLNAIITTGNRCNKNIFSRDYFDMPTN